MYGENTNTKINSSANKVKRRSVGTNTDGNFRCPNCTNRFEDINHPKMYFVPYIPCMNDSCFQNNMARTINACKCKCSSQTNVHDHKLALQSSKVLHGNRSSLPPWEKRIGDNSETVPKICQTDGMKHIAKKPSKSNLSASNSVPSVHVIKPKQSHIPHHTLTRKTGNRLSNNLIDVERHASELLKENSRPHITDHRLMENEDENSDEIIDEESKIYKLLVPSFKKGNSVMDDNDENCSASENEEGEDESAIHFSALNNRSQRPDETMLMMMQAFVSEQNGTKRDSKLSKLLNHLVPSGFVGESSNENRDMSFPFRKK